MKKVMLWGICLFAMFITMQNEAWSQMLEPGFKLEKVNGSVYVGRQVAPLDPILGTGPGTYLTVNLYVIVSEDRHEVLLIDAPGLPELMTPFMQALETEFPGVTIKGVLLTHDHLDHCWSTPVFAALGIPVYANSAEIAAAPRQLDLPLSDLAFATAIDPGFSIRLGTGTVTAINLTGHTPGHMGYGYYPDDEKGKINWFFAGDAVIAPPDYEAVPDPYDITNTIRMMMLVQDTFSLSLWEQNLVEVEKMLTLNAKLFPGHGPIREGYLWKDPAGYIDYTVTLLKRFQALSSPPQ